MITPKRIKKEIYKTVYVTEDGEEFDSQYEAQQHEDNLLAYRKIPYVYGGFINSLDCGVDCYYIESKDDLEYLKAKEWRRNATCAYAGPGWYLAQRFDGGDYDDYYHIIKLDKYIEMLEADLKQLKDLTKI